MAGSVAGSVAKSVATSMARSVAKLEAVGGGRGAVRSSDIGTSD